MQYRSISDFPQREHFLYYSAMENPYVTVTVPVDLTALCRACDATGTSFSLALAYCAGRAANAVPALRQRIVEGQPVEFHRCNICQRVLREDGTYTHCQLNPVVPFRVFAAQAARLQTEPRENDSPEECDTLGLLYLSPMPQLSYRALQLPAPADGSPRISWGKATVTDGRTELPITLQAHYGLVDDGHIAQFYGALAHTQQAFAEKLRADRAEGKVPEVPASPQAPAPKTTASGRYLVLQRQRALMGFGICYYCALDQSREDLLARLETLSRAECCALPELTSISNGGTVRIPLDSAAHSFLIALFPDDRRMVTREIPIPAGNEDAVFRIKTDMDIRRGILVSVGPAEQEPT